MSSQWTENLKVETMSDSRERQVRAARQRIELFKALQVEDYEKRFIALEMIIQVVKSFIRSTFSSPSSAVASPLSLSDCGQSTSTILDNSSNISSNIVNTQQEDYDEQEYNEQLFYYLLTILRLSLSCPYSDVRQTFKDFLNGLKESTTLSIPKPRYKSPSHFILLKSLFSLESNASSNQVIHYPRSSNLSLSPWNNASAAASEDSLINIEKSPAIVTPPQIDHAPEGRPSDEYVRSMMIDAFNYEGRISNIARVLFFFPTFLETHQNSYRKIIKSQKGPLTQEWKAYLALMVASEQKCQYLASIAKLDFLTAGGNPHWLSGLDHVPTKLKNISVYILKLSRQPWRLVKDDIDRLMTSRVMGDNWKTGELVQATLILATFLGLSSFILGCGITPEVDMTGGFLMPEIVDDDQNNLASGVENELALPNNIAAQSICPHRQKPDQQDIIELGPVPKNNHNKRTADEEEVTNELIHKLKKSNRNSELIESLIKCKIGAATPSPPEKMTINTTASVSKEDQQKQDSPGPQDVNYTFENLSRFVDATLDQQIQHEEFDANHQDYTEFMLGEYCWEDHGCSLANHYLPGSGDALASEFAEAIAITDWSMFHPVEKEVVDTTPLRHAIWHYTQKIMGVTKEDYTYSDIPTFLNNRTTEYIRNLCMSPHEIQKDDWYSIGISLRPEEKCHVNLLIASARKQALLCFGLYLISEV